MSLTFGPSFDPNSSMCSLRDSGGVNSEGAVGNGSDDEYKSCRYCVSAKRDCLKAHRDLFKSGSGKGKSSLPVVSVRLDLPRRLTGMHRNSI